MSSFWSGWIIFFVILNWSVVVILFVVANRVRIPMAEDGTTGHVWSNGEIREGARKLPAWWVIMSVASMAFTFFYLHRYPGFGSHPGSLEWSAAKESQEDIASNRINRAEFNRRVITLPVNELSRQADVQRVGAILFADNCAACHGDQGQGNHLIGAPRLTDNIWLYGDGEQIRVTIENGRAGVMPPFAQLSETETREVAEYVYTLNGRPSSDTQLTNNGKVLFSTHCVACHGGEGKGNQMLGAPNLTDHNWLYGGDTDHIFDTIRHGRQGKMPAWKERLTEAEIKVLMAWIKASATDNPDAKNSDS
ncbi:MAG: cytochrome-c oxidase, cbb3-type subunit III [Parahaliea sp.]